MLRIVAVTWMSVLIGCSADAPFPPKTVIAVMLRSGVRLENVSCESVSPVTRAEAGASGWYVVRSTTADPVARYELVRIRAEVARLSANARYRIDPFGAETGQVVEFVKQMSSTAGSGTVQGVSVFGSRRWRT